MSLRVSRVRFADYQLREVCVLERLDGERYESFVLFHRYPHNRESGEPPIVNSIVPGDAVN